MWIAVSVFILIVLFGDDISDCIKAKADELRAKAEMIRHDISQEQKEQNETR